MEKIHDMSDNTVVQLKIKVFSYYLYVMLIIATFLFALWFLRELLNPTLPTELKAALWHLSPVIECVLALFVALCTWKAMKYGHYKTQLHRLRVWNGCVAKYGLSKAKEMAATEILLNSSQIKELENIATENEEEK